MKERFFYRVEYPHEYQNGYSSHMNDEHLPIADMKEARELAIKKWTGRFGVGGHRRTSYGVEYEWDFDDLVDGKPE